MSKSDYIDYVRQVLGVKTILSNEPTATETLAIPLLVYVEDFKNYLPPEKELLDKMLAALKRSPTDMHILDLNDVITAQAGVTLYLTDELKVGRELAANEIHTYSPRILLKDAGLKKAAWAQLQKILLYFQQSTKE